MNSFSSRKVPLDRRVNAFRTDLAAENLRGIVEAPAFVRGHPMQLTAAKASLHKEPDSDSSVETQLIYGDDVTVYDRAGSWSWVQNNRDGYVGYLPTDSLSEKLIQPTHKIIALASFAYRQPDLKTPLPDRLFMNSRLHVVGEVGDFIKLSDERFVYKNHVAELDEVADDFVSVAQRHVEVPYLWGGRTSDGIDCSGLVQVAYEVAGLNCPRDSDMQQHLEGRDLDLGGMEEMQRGDFIFWQGHVAIMIDDAMLVHANARHMKVSIEPFHAVVTRTAAHGGGDIIAIRRPAVLSAAAL